VHRTRHECRYPRGTLGAGASRSIASRRQRRRFDMKYFPERAPAAARGYRICDE